jgi:hypothetical protein
MVNPKVNVAAVAVDVAAVAGIMKTLMALK